MVEKKGWCDYLTPLIFTGSLSNESLFEVQGVTSVSSHGIERQLAHNSIWRKPEAFNGGKEDLLRILSTWVWLPHFEFHNVNTTKARNHVSWITSNIERTRLLKAGWGWEFPDLGNRLTLQGITLYECDEDGEPWAHVGRPPHSPEWLQVPTCVDFCPLSCTAMVNWFKRRTEWSYLWRVHSHLLAVPHVLCL